MNKDFLPDDAAVRSLTDLGVTLAEPREILGDGSELVALAYTVPDGYNVTTVNVENMLAPYRNGPAHATGQYVVKNVASFLAYYAKHAQADAETWVSPKEIVAVLDANTGVHGGPAFVPGDTRWERHRLVLQLVHSPEWIKWTNYSGKFIAQSDFAEFLEDCVGHIKTPDMATVLEVAQSLQATVKVDFKSAYRTQDGRRAFKYEETATTRAGQKGELEIPERLTLRLRVYEGQEPTDIVARFRYRITGDNLQLGIVIDQIPEILEQALDEVRITIADCIDRGNVYTGVPA